MIIMTMIIIIIITKKKNFWLWPLNAMKWRQNQKKNYDDDDHDDDHGDDHDDLPPLVAQQGEPIETSSIGHACCHLAQTFHIYDISMIVIIMNQGQDKDENFQHGHGSTDLKLFVHD